MGPLTLIVTALDRDDLVLAGEFEQRVHVLGIRPPVRRATFETVLDFGGRRLALCGRGGEPVVVAGAWERHGACAYDASTGERRWQRKDLKRVQRLSPAADGSLVAVGREGAMQILDTATGGTVATLRSAEQLWQSRHTATASTSYGNAVTLRDSATWAPLWKNRVPGFAVLSVDFAPDGVLVGSVADLASTGCSALSCFGLEGTMRWQLRAPNGVVWNPVARDQSTSEWVAVEYHVDRKTPTSIVRWSDGGSFQGRVAIEGGIDRDAAFLPGGQGLVTTLGSLVDARSGRASLAFSNLALN